MADESDVAGFAKLTDMDESLAQAAPVLTPGGRTPAGAPKAVPKAAPKPPVRQQPVEPLRPADEPSPSYSEPPSSSLLASM